MEKDLTHELKIAHAKAKTLRRVLFQDACRLDETTTMTWSQAISSYNSSIDFRDGGLQHHRDQFNDRKKLCLRPAILFGAIGVGVSIQTIVSGQTIVPGMLTILCAVGWGAAFLVSKNAHQGFIDRQVGKFEMNANLARNVALDAQDLFAPGALVLDTNLIGLQEYETTLKTIRDALESQVKKPVPGSVLQPLFDLNLATQRKPLGGPQEKKP